MLNVARTSFHCCYISSPTNMADLASARDEEYYRPASRQRISAAPEVRDSKSLCSCLGCTALMLSSGLGMLAFRLELACTMQVDTAGLALDEYSGTALAATSMEHLQGRISP